MSKNKKKNKKSNHRRKQLSTLGPALPHIPSIDTVDCVFKPLGLDQHTVLAFPYDNMKSHFKKCLYFTSTMYGVHVQEHVDLIEKYTNKINQLKNGIEQLEGWFVTASNDKVIIVAAMDQLKLREVEKAERAAELLTEDKLQAKKAKLLKELTEINNKLYS